MATTETVVRTSRGAVRGTTDQGVSVFKGIPYAAPPFGERRFAAPEPAPAWDGVRDALGFGPTALHPGYVPPFSALLPDPIIPGEDCLNLNVWTPDPGAGGLPVTVFVHGGAFVNGSGAVPTYDGTAFARDGVVLVTFNYRLGVDGFAHLADAVDNRGLLDQLAALRWVQEEIAAFGGDPGQVTVFGESAGAMSIGCLLASPRAEGLFRRAVLQSGAGHHAVRPETAKLVAAELGARLGVDPTAEALAAVGLEPLIAAQSQVVLEAQLNPDPARWGEVAQNLMAFEPVVDGDLLPDLPIRRLAAGAAAGVDLLVGTTAEEFRFFMVPNGIIDHVPAEGVTGLAAAYGLDAPAAVAAYRAHHPDGTPGDLLADLTSDWFFRIPALRTAEARAAAGERAHVYEFAWGSPAHGGRLGSCHALELAFVFDTLSDPTSVPMVGTEPPQALADEVHAAWARFAATGDPGWPAYDPATRAVMRFADGASAVVEDPRSTERALWEGVR